MEDYDNNGHGVNAEYQSNTFEIVSKIAFFIGVNKIYFDNMNPFESIWYEKLIKDKEARIIRNLCIIRTQLLNGFTSINYNIMYKSKNLDDMPKLIDLNALKRLEQDQVDMVIKNPKTIDYIISFSNEISMRIDTCRKWFPIWLSWDYIKGLFVIPNIEKKSQVKNVRKYFVENIRSYPYKMYIQCRVQGQGNILNSDAKFISILYKINHDYFPDRSKTKDASKNIRENITQFIGDSGFVDVVVDCENTDVFKVYSMLDGLDTLSKKKIRKIILFNDPNTSKAWNLLEHFLDIEIEHRIFERVKKDKSLVDMGLTVGVCREHYEKNVDSFILVASDSDYWGLILELPQCRFAVAVERESVSPSVLDAYRERGIFYYYLDRFYTGNLEKFQAASILTEMQITSQELQIPFDLNELFEHALLVNRIKFSEEEKVQFFERYLKNIHL